MKNKTEDKTPTADWANWALLDAVSKLDNFKSDEAMNLFALIVGRFRETLGNGFEHSDDEARKKVGEGPRRFVLITDFMTWGVGKTLKEAAEKAKKAGAPGRAKACAALVLNCDKPWVDDMGFVRASSKATVLTIGFVGTVAGLMKAKGGA